MALAIDSSSPAASVATTQNNTCASFTPPDSPLLLAAWAGDSKANTDPPAAPSPSSSPAQTWSTYVWDHRSSGSSPVLDGQTAFFAALVAGTPGASTVSILNGENTISFGSVLKPYVITGHDPVAPIGATGSGRANTASSISGSYVGTIDGGQGFMVVSDWDATSSTPWTAASGCTILNKGTITGEISYAVIQRTSADGVAGQTTTLGMSGLGGIGSFHYSFLEVISAEAAQAARSLGRLLQTVAPQSNW
jgi:hypothetical protein